MLVAHLESMELAYQHRLHPEMHHSNKTQINPGKPPTGHKKRKPKSRKRTRNSPGKLSPSHCFICSSKISVGVLSFFLHFLCLIVCWQNCIEHFVLWRTVSVTTGRILLAHFHMVHQNLYPKSTMKSKSSSMRTIVSWKSRRTSHSPGGMLTQDAKLQSNTWRKLWWS